MNEFNSFDGFNKSSNSFDSNSPNLNFSNPEIPSIHPSVSDVTVSEFTFTIKDLDSYRHLVYEALRALGVMKYIDESTWSKAVNLLILGETEEEAKLRGLKNIRNLACADKNEFVVSFNSANHNLCIVEGGENIINLEIKSFSYKCDIRVSKLAGSTQFTHKDLLRFFNRITHIESDDIIQ